ncbi:Spy/CpxP family protein refolding chaperone [Nitrospira sp. M1]
MIRKIVGCDVMILTLTVVLTCLPWGFALADEGHSHSEQGMSHHSGDMKQYSGSEHGGMQHHMSASPLSMKEELGLKDEQVKKLEPVESDYRKTMIKNGADLRVAMIDLGSLLDQTETDRSAVATKVEEIGGLQTQLMMYRVDTLLKLKEILTPEQYQQFRDRLKQQMDRGMSGRMHGMSGQGKHGSMGTHGYGQEHSEGYGHGKDLR